jgi:hypothetical protein
MDKTFEDEPPPVPPTASRVAARAMVLSAVCCRAFIEKDAGKSGAEDLRLQILPWLDGLGILGELETSELEIISTPLGGLHRKKVLNTAWKCEGLVVLAWALGFAKLPRFHVQCEASDIANELGFIERWDSTALASPRIVMESEIERWANAYLTLHWRLRAFMREPTRMDLPLAAEVCNWGPLTVRDLEILDNDLAVDGVRIEKLDAAKFRELVSITQERHQALNWLLGFEAIYSQVTTDT